MKRRCLGMLGAALSWAGIAAGTPARVPHEPTRAALDIVLFGPELSCHALQTEVAALLPKDAAVVWTHHEGSPEPMKDPQTGFAQIWIDASRSGVVRVLTAPGGPKPSLRVVDVPVLDVVSAEVVAQIVRASAVALLDDARTAADVERTTSEPGQSAPPRVPAPPTMDASVTRPKDVEPTWDDDADRPRSRRSHPPTYEVGAAYVTRGEIPALFGTQGVDVSSQGAEASVAVLFWDVPVRPFVSFAADLVKTSFSGMGSDGHGWSTRLSVGVEWEAAQWTKLRLALGAGVDYVSIDYASMTAPGGRAQVGAVFPLPLDTLEIVGTLTLDVGERFSDISKSRFQPGATIGVGWRW
jgi:hypothetical protein